MLSTRRVTNGGGILMTIRENKILGIVVVSKYSSLKRLIPKILLMQLKYLKYGVLKLFGDHLSIL